MATLRPSAGETRLEIWTIVILGMVIVHLIPGIATWLPIGYARGG